jgi:arylsulfatase A-like enzyme
MIRRSLLLAASLLLSACEPSGPVVVPGPGALERLRPRAATDSAPAPVAREVRRLDPIADPEGWAVDAPMVSLDPPGWLPKGTRPMLQGGAARREVTVRIRCRKPFDPRTFQRIQLVASVDGRGGLGMAAELRQRGVLLANSEPQRLARHGQLELLSFDIPRKAAEAEWIDEISFVITGGRRVLAIAEVILLDAPPGLDLPDPEVGPELVRVVEEARPAFGLLPGRPLEASFTVPEGGLLRFAWARPRRVAGPDTASRLVLTLDGAVSTVQELEGGGRMGDGTIAWRDHELDLSKWAGREVDLSLALDPSTPDAPLAVSVPHVVQRGTDAPTVLLITSDTHRADHLGAQPGNVGLATPVVDALAERGVLFTDAYAPVNNTNPSHAALMTATHPRDTGVLDNYHPLSAEPLTLAECFADAGWTTWAVLSSMHLGPVGSGLGQGFDRVSWPRIEAQRPGDQTLQELLDWLPDAEGRPLFVWLHLFDAHTPYEPPADAAARHWDPDRDPFDPALPADVPDTALPGDMKGLREVEWGRAMYRAEVEAQDTRLAAVLEHPRFASGLVAFVADHGESLGEHELWFDHMGAYPSTLHIPLVLAGPGVPEGRVVERPVTHLDLGATLLRLAGLEDAGLPGRDLLTELDARGPSEPRFSLEAGPLSAAVTHQGMHLVLSLQARGGPGKGPPHARHAVELYDLATDPGAEHDVSADRPDVAAALRGRLIDWLGAARGEGWAASSAVDADMADALAELGYVAGTGGGGALFEPDGCEACAPYEG